MQHLKRIGEILANYYDKVILGVLLLALAGVMVHQGMAMTKAREKVEQARQQVKLKQKSVTPLEASHFTASLDLDPSRLWRSSFLLRPWASGTVPGKLATEPLGQRLYRDAEGSLFDPVVYIFTPNLDDTLVHYTSEIHPKTGVSIMEQVQVQRKAQSLSLTSATGACLLLSWDPRNRQPSGQIMGELCFSEKVQGRTWVARHSLPLNITYSGDQALEVVWDQANPRTQGRLQLASKTGTAMSAVPERPEPLAITSGTIGEAVACECKENVPVVKICEQVHLLTVRQPRLNFELTSVRPGANLQDKRSWTVQMDVWDANNRKRSQFPIINGTIEGTTYKLVDVEFKEFRNQEGVQLRQEFSATVQHATEANAEPIVLRKGERPAAGPAEYLLVLPDRSRRTAKIGEVFEATMPGGVPETLTLKSGTDTSVLLHPTTEGQEPCERRILSPEERRKLLGTTESGSGS